MRPGQCTFHVIGSKSIPDGQRAKELDQHIKRTHQGLPWLNPLSGHRIAQGTGLNQLQPVGRQEENAADCSRLVTGTTRPLHEARHAFGAAYLHDGFDRPEVDPEVQRTRTNHGLQVPFVQGILHPIAEVFRDGAVVQREDPCEVRSDFEQFVVPNLRLGPGIRKNEGALVGTNDLDHMFCELYANVACPRQAFKPVGHQGPHFGAFGPIASNQPSRAAGSDQDPQGLVEVSDGG